MNSAITFSRPSIITSREAVHPDKIGVILQERIRNKRWEAHCTLCKVQRSKHSLQLKNKKSREIFAK